MGFIQPPETFPQFQKANGNSFLTERGEKEELSPQRRRGSVKASEVIKGDKVGAREANGRAASCSSLGKREYGGAARRRKSRDRFLFFIFSFNEV